MSSTEKNIFINGKKQIIEMLQFMSEDEKRKLLENIKYKNPTMAKELTEKSFSFNSLFNLDDSVIKSVLKNTNPTIIGLALYLVDSKKQRKALQLMDRSEAEKAFHIMGQNLETKKAECIKAQNKLVNIAITLNSKNNS